MRGIIWVVILMLGGCSLAQPQDTERRAVVVSFKKPAYPAKAFSERLPGEVKVKYDVDSSGSVVNTRVVSVTPEGYGFEKEVLKSLSHWKYKMNKPLKNIPLTIQFTVSSGPILAN